MEAGPHEEKLLIKVASPERSRRVGRLVTWLIGLALPLFAAPVQAAPSVADFFKHDAFASLVMSPSGKRICTTVPRADGRLTLVVMDLEDLSKSKVVAGFSDADVWGAQWVNDDRLVFRIYDRNQPAALQRGTGLFAVDARGSEAPRVLIRPQWLSVSHESSQITQRTLQPDHVLHSLLRDGSNDVVVAETVFQRNGEVRNVNLKRLDTATGAVRSISQGAPDGVLRWTLDSKGQPRFVIAGSGDKEIVYWKAASSVEWKKIDETERYTGRRLTPLYVDPADRIYGRLRFADSEFAVLATFDPTAGVQAKPLLELKGYDFDGQLVLNGAGAVIGVRYLTDARATHWFDGGMRKIQEQVDTMLQSTNNRIDCGDCDQRERVLVVSSSDRQPPIYSLFDAKAGTLKRLVEARPWIDRRAMAARDMVRIDARDGLSLPVHVTRPNGQKEPAPTVVLVHGGPFLRGGEWRWTPEVQFLASRGYVVIEPEFRGSTGFGFKHFRAGWKQLGLAMQDDIADAAKWAVQRGHADPSRMCVAGAGYGGYATLMGLIRNPELFRCGFEWAGVTDIDLMYAIDWSDLSELWKTYGMPRLIGDRVQDAAQLANTSPLKLAEKVTQPVLMAYGGADRRVPIEHGIRFRDAVRKTNTQVEWVEYPEEGHGWLMPANSIDFWTRVERFLDKNLKNAR
jgi:dipeptidyl aminopeptidase/acylaminoacyl peptidase